MDEAHLTQVQVIRFAGSTFTQRESRSGQWFSHPKCMLHCISNVSSRLTSLCYTIDPTCVLLPPRATTRPEPSLFKKVITALATRYDTSAANVQRVCSAESMQTWGKVRRLDGGDTMHAAGVIKAAQDSRDATFVRVSHCFIFH